MSTGISALIQELQDRIQTLEARVVEVERQRDTLNGDLAKTRQKGTTAIDPLTVINPLKKYDCRACGACCKPLFDDPVYVDVLPKDIQRMPKRYQKLVTLGALKTKQTKFNGCACVALIGRIGYKVYCDIHAVKPKVCKNFRPGSRECKNSRRDAGIK